MQNFRTIATAGLIGFERFKSACASRVLSDRLFWSFLADFDCNAIGIESLCFE
jgi:hypothetical protein